VSILFVDGQRVETSEREPLKLGDFVKVQLPAPTPDGLTESPWAEVVELMSDGRWLGRIANPLMEEHGVDYGDCVVFERTDDGSHWWWEPVETPTPKALN
jgi:hypothetical protein